MEDYCFITFALKPQTLIAHEALHAYMVSKNAKHVVNKTKCNETAMAEKQYNFSRVHNTCNKYCTCNTYFGYYMNKQGNKLYYSHFAGNYDYWLNDKSNITNDHTKLLSSFSLPRVK